MDTDLEIINPIEVKSLKQESENIFFDFNKIQNNCYNKIIDFIKNKDSNIFIQKAEKLPGFINTLKGLIPQKILQANLSKEQLEQIKKGVLKLMRDNDGNLMAVLTKTEGGKIVSQVRLKEVNMTPDLNKSVNDFVVQQQLGEIVNLIQGVKASVDKIINGLQDDRIALCNSSKQQLLLTNYMEDKNLKEIFLLQVIKSAEDSRNMLMLSIQRDIDYIIETNKPSDFSLFCGSIKNEEVHKIVHNINHCFSILNETSLVEAASYFKLDEKDAMIKSLEYHTNYIKNTFSKDVCLLLNSNYESCNNYWTNEFPKSLQRLDKMIDNVKSSSLKVCKKDSLFLLPKE